MRRRWYLIQVDMESTLRVNKDYATNRKYLCIFLARHSDNTKKSDEFYWWWPDWHRYSTDPVLGDVIYGDRVLIRSSTTPGSTKCIQWSTLLPLFGPNSVSLHGPFPIAPINEHNRVRQRIHRASWDMLVSKCSTFCILPPTIGTTCPPHQSHRPNQAKTKKKKK